MSRSTETDSTAVVCRCEVLLPAWLETSDSSTTGARSRGHRSGVTGRTQVTHSPGAGAMETNEVADGDIWDLGLAQADIEFCDK